MSKVPRIAEITIRFTSWWQGGTGASAGRDIDMAAYKDDDGCPALPMTQVKGTLRDIAATFDLLSVEDEIAYFGERTRPDADDAKGAAIRFTGEARLSAAERAFFRSNQAARAQLFSDIASTAIDGASGTALTDSLRRAEVVVPVTLTTHVEWVEGAPPEDWIDTLNTICAFTPAFGKMKNDGFGRAITGCTPVNATPKSSLASSDHERTTDDDGPRVLVLTFEAEDPFVFSRTAATEGGHHTLTAPTGAALLGWAAGRLYDSLDAATAYTMFHSGKIRFSEAMPLEGEVPLFPRPSILLRPKHSTGKPGLGRGAFEKEHGPDVQAEPVGMIPVTLDGKAQTGPRLRHRLRTAMEQGKAKTGALFGYESVSPTGRKFRATIEDLDRVLGADEWQALRAAFDGQSLHLGRGRRSGYGGSFHCGLEGDDPWPEPKLPADGKPLRLWLLTDACMLDDHGNPNLLPDAKDFGLEDGWAPVSGETTVTARRIWPWNGHLKARDLEMAVIEAGSVFTFVWNGLDAPTKAPSAVVGHYCERGYGRVAVIPDDFNFIEPEEVSAAAVTEPAQNGPPTPLAQWALAAVQASEGSVAIDQWVDARAAELDGLVNAMAPRGPSRSQWSNVSLISDASDVGRALKHEDWAETLLSDGIEITLRDYVQSRLFVGNPFGPVALERVIQHVRQTVQGLGR